MEGIPRHEQIAPPVGDVAGERATSPEAANPPLPTHPANEGGEEPQVGEGVTPSLEVPLDAAKQRQPEGGDHPPVSAPLDEPVIDVVRAVGERSVCRARGAEPQNPIGREGLPSHMTALPWIDPEVERQGFGPRSMYVEACWLPVLGPTATWVYRRLGSWVAANEDGTVIDLTDLSVSLGLGEGLGRTGLLGRSLTRLHQFGAIELGREHMAVRRALAPLSEHRARSLSYSAYQLHAHLTLEKQLRNSKREGL